MTGNESSSVTKNTIPAIPQVVSRLSAGAVIGRLPMNQQQNQIAKIHASVGTTDSIGMK